MCEAESCLLFFPKNNSELDKIKHSLIEKGKYKFFLIMAESKPEAMEQDPKKPISLIILG